jgi:DNA-binding FrmR family transcriptional regulator
MKDTQSQAVARLHRLEGQIRAIERLIDRQRPLPIILQQLRAVEAAIASLIILLVEDRLDRSEEGVVQLSESEAAWVKRLLR